MTDEATPQPPPLLGLEARLRALAAKGELTHFSLAAVAGKGPKGVVWSASYCPASSWGAGFGRDADPIKAAMMAFEDVRLPAAIKRLAKQGNADAKEVVESLAKGTPTPPDADAKLRQDIKARGKAADEAPVIGEEDFV